MLLRIEGGKWDNMLAILSGLNPNVHILHRDGRDHPCLDANSQSGLTASDIPKNARLNGRSSSLGTLTTFAGLALGTDRGFLSADRRAFCRYLVVTVSAGDLNMSHFLKRATYF